MRRATFWFIFGTVLLDMLALGIIAPVLPKLVIQLEGGNEASAAGLFGLFGTVWAAMQFLFAPVLGSLSDRVGRRPVILLSCLGLGLDYFIMALAPTVGWLFVGPESLPLERRASFQWRRANPIGSLGMLRARGALLGLAFVAFLYRVAHDALPSVFVLYGDYRFGWTARTVGFALAIVGAASI